VARLGLEAMLGHAIATWLEAGAQFEDYADFERDGFRCTVPAGDVMDRMAYLGSKGG
jgi:hypothetical protein